MNDPNSAGQPSREQLAQYFPFQNLSRPQDSNLEPTGQERRMLPLDHGNALEERAKFDKVNIAAEELPTWHEKRISDIRYFFLTSGQNSFLLPMSSEPLSLSVPLTAVNATIVQFLSAKL